MAATYHSVIGTLKLHGGLFWDFSVLFSKISLTAAGTMLTGYPAKSHWLPVNVKFEADYLTKLVLGHFTVPFQWACPKLSAYDYFYDFMQNLHKEALELASSI